MKRITSETSMMDDTDFAPNITEKGPENRNTEHNLNLL